MHELSIAMEILHIVVKTAGENGSTSVKTINLKVGDLSGVEVDSLSFSFDAIKGENEVTGGSELVIKKVPVVVRCADCDDEFETNERFLACPACTGFDTLMLQGDELSITDIEVE